MITHLQSSLPLHSELIITVVAGSLLWNKICAKYIHYPQLTNNPTEVELSSVTLLARNTVRIFKPEG